MYKASQGAFYIAYHLILTGGGGIYAAGLIPMLFETLSSLTDIRKTITIAALSSFILTFLLLGRKFAFLPRDQGRLYAVNGEKSKGKIRGAGIIIAFVFILVSLLFIDLSLENILSCVIILLVMLSGYLDDASKTPWSDYKKGLIDLILSVSYMVLFVLNNPTDIYLFGKLIHLDPVVYGILGVVLIWVSINVTNCTDGVDGLCGSLSIISILSFVLIFNIQDKIKADSLILVSALLAYLIFNSSPSSMLMGDAGSRTLGFFLAVISMKSGHPFAFIPFVLVMILDGGLGLVKVFLLRFLKISILRDTRTPLHDEMRKNRGWSDTQVVFRFCIMQVIISALSFVLLMNN